MTHTDYMRAAFSQMRLADWELLQAASQECLRQTSRRDSADHFRRVIEMCGKMISLHRKMVRESLSVGAVIVENDSQWQRV